MSVVSNRHGDDDDVVAVADEDDWGVSGETAMSLL